MADRHVHIIDDDASVRRSTTFLLQANGYTATPWVSGTAFLDGIETARPGCILLDIRMPGVDGLHVQQELNHRRITMPVVVFTGHGDVTAAIAAMKGGAIDFLEKPVKKIALIQAIDDALDRLAGSLRHASSAQHARSIMAALTPRERAVLQGLARGLSNKGIARQLSISVRTVEIHRAHAMVKLDAKSLSQALRIAFAAEACALDG